MSTDEEIREVYESDIENKTKRVLLKRGILPFLNGRHDMSIETILPQEIMDELHNIALADERAFGSNRERRIREKQIAFLQEIGRLDKEDK